MRDDLANLVNPILRTALDLRDGWAAGTGPSLDAGRQRLRDRFAPLLRAHPPGTSTTTAPIDLLSASAPPETAYLGVAYPLACWIDELFTLRSPVASQWTDRKLEVEYFGTNDRAWRFWVQADLAAGRQDTDHLEVFFLCAALGFRGEKLDDPAAYTAWATATRDRLLPDRAADWVGPPALDPPASVPPRYGFARLRRMAVAAGVFALVAVPVAMWLVARLLVR
jgi:type VI protein secretion system component VasF